MDADQFPVAGPGEVQLQQPEAVFVGMFQRLQTVAARHSLRGDAAGVEDHQGGVELLRLSGDGRKGDGQAGGAERGAPADREAVSMRERISSETMGMGGILL